MSEQGDMEDSVVETATLEGFRLSSQQRHLWSLEGTEVVYRVEGAILLTGEVCLEILEQALGDLVDGHEILRTALRCLPGMELPFQILEEGSSVELLREDLPDADWRAAVELWVAREAAAFEPGQGRLAQFRLATLDDDSMLLLISLSALVADFLSLDNLLCDLATAYEHRVRGEDPTVEAVQYADFSEWQGSLAEEEEGEPSRRFWQQHDWQRLVKDPLHPGRAKGAFKPRALIRPLEGEVRRRLARVAEAFAVPEERVLLTLWYGLIFRLGGRREVLLGCLSNGRGAPELAEALGPFALYVPTLCRLAADFELREAVAVVSEAVREARSHQELLTLEEHGVDFLPLLFDHRVRPARREAGGLAFTPVVEHGFLDRHHLRLAVVSDGESITLEFGYDAAFLGQSVAERLAERFATFLGEALKAPERPLGDLEILGPVERRQLVVEWNATSRPLTDEAPITELFKEQVEHAGDRLALVWPEGQLSFRELDRRARALAHRLVHCGVGPEQTVALCLERSPALVVAAVATLLAEGAFLVIEPWQPEVRRRRLLEESKPRVVVTRPDFFTSAETTRPTSVAEYEIGRLELAEVPPPLTGDGALPTSGLDPENLAYGIFTSGSTGRPKGVMICHRAVRNLLAALSHTVYREVVGPLLVSLNAPLSFDASIKQLVQMASGHTLFLVPEEVRPDGQALLEVLRRHRLEVLDTTPTQLRLLLAEGLFEGPHPLKRCLVGGEAVSEDLWQRLAAAGDGHFWNVYGPTECTVDTTAIPIATGEAVTLGRPLDNMRVYGLDRALRLVPTEVAGELCIAGAGLARGYLGQPARTAERFVPDPFSAHGGGRLYRSGDRGWHREDGRLEFLGRVDRQVKLRGFRVELEEIETVLASAPGARGAVALVDQGSTGEERLLAYVAGTQAATDGRPRHPLPNGQAVYHQNHNETEYLYREIFENRCYANHGVRLPDAPVVIDVGANIGMFSLFVHLFRPRARVYAFEPLAPLFETLELNSQRYFAGARLFSFGLAAAESTEQFTFYPRYTMMSGASNYADATSEVEVIKRFLDNAQEQDAEAATLLAQADELLEGRFEGQLHEVRLRRLSDVLREEGIDRIDLLKIDVQRAEMDVLRGLGEEDWAKIGQIVLEVHDEAGGATDGRLERMRRLFEAKGFEVFAEQDELLVGTDRYNVYALRRNRPGDLLEGELKIPEEPVEVTVEALRRHARERLPEPMLPAAIVVLDALPLNANGKVDLAALPAPEEVAATEVAAAEPETPFEELLAEIWKELLGVEAVGPESNFFELGGHSLLATRLMSRLRHTFQVELPLRSLFEAPILSDLARRVGDAMSGGGGALGEGIEKVEGEMPLSFAQHRLWFVQQMEPESNFYNSQNLLRIIGRLEPAVLSRTLTEVVRRHRVLRTVLPEIEGKPTLRVLPAAEIPLPIVDLSGLTDPGLEFGRLQRMDARRPFDLAQGPLLRALLLRLPEPDAGQDEVHLMIFSLHHIVGDAWSMGILVREIAGLYRSFCEGLPSPFDELAIQYSDYAHWQRRLLSGETLEALLTYWRGRMGGELPALSLPTARQPPAQATVAGARRSFTLPAALATTVEEFSRASEVTLFMTLLAAFQAFLARLTHQEDVIVGTPIAGRNRHETEGLIGLFINMLALRTNLTGNPSFKELLDQVREVTLGAYAHQDLPFDKLVEELQPERSLSRAPIIQVTFTVQNVPGEDLVLPGLRFEDLPVATEAARFDLTVWVYPSAEGLDVAWTYRTDLFDAVAIERWHAQYTTLLEAVMVDPEIRLKALEITTENEREEKAQSRSRREAANVGRLKTMRRRRIQVP